MDKKKKAEVNRGKLRARPRDAARGAAEHYSELAQMNLKNIIHIYDGKKIIAKHITTIRRMVKASK